MTQITYDQRWQLENPPSCSICPTRLVCINATLHYLPFQCTFSTHTLVTKPVFVWITCNLENRLKSFIVFKYIFMQMMLSSVTESSDKTGGAQIGPREAETGVLRYLTHTYFCQPLLYLSLLFPVFPLSCFFFSERLWANKQVDVNAPHDWCRCLCLVLLTKRRSAERNKVFIYCFASLEQ